MADYNGWTNYQTWNVAMWFSADPGLYTARTYWLREQKPRDITGKTVREFIQHRLPSGTPDLWRRMWEDRAVTPEVTAEVYKGVNWAEIARSWKEDRSHDS